MALQAAQMEPIDYSYRHKKFDTIRLGDGSSLLEYDINMATWLTATPKPCADTFSNIDCNNNNNSSNNKNQNENNNKEGDDDDDDMCSLNFEAFRQNRSMRHNTSTPYAAKHGNGKRRLCTTQGDSGIACTPIRSERRRRERLSHVDKLKHGRSLNLNRTSYSITPANLKSLPPGYKSDALMDICKYHGNMVRKFPKRERTKRDQDRRDKNTLACRLSRRMKKLENLAVEEDYNELMQRCERIVERTTRKSLYLKHLNELLESATMQVKSEQDADEKDLASPALLHRSFSIDFLLSTEKDKL